MDKILQPVEKFLRKGFWITKENKRDLEAEARKRKISESALMRYIISQWFKR